MLNETIEAININIKRAKADSEEITSWNNLIPEIFENNEKRRTVDSFIFRFTKIQDLIGEKLFKEILDKVGEYQRNMSFTEILDRAEKLEIIESADKWSNFRELRNSLSHEYPSNEVELIKDIKLALDYFAEILCVYENITKYIKSKKLSD